MFEPVTGVRMLKDVACDPMQKNVLSFANVTEQTNYYMSHVKHTFMECRPFSDGETTNAIILPGTPDQFYDCNYMMYQNPQYSGRWFYAFVKEIKMLNAGASIIVYDIDFFQTWYFEWNVKPSFVEREHSKTDNFGENLIPESFDTGDYLCSFDKDISEIPSDDGEKLDMTPVLLIGYTYSADAKSISIAVNGAQGSTGAVSTVKIPYMLKQYAGGNIQNGMYQGCKLIAFEYQDKSTGTGTLTDPAHGVRAVNLFIKWLTLDGQIDKIVGAPTIVPKYLISSGLATWTHWEKYELAIDGIESKWYVDAWTPPVLQGTLEEYAKRPITAEFNISIPQQIFQGYKPKNKKLFTQPYTFIAIDNNRGGTLEYAWEYFLRKNVAEFRLDGAVGVRSTLRMVPLSYKMSNVNYSECIDIDGFPMASFAYSGFANYVGANREGISTKQTLDYAGRVAKGIMNIPMNPLGAVFGSVGSAVDFAFNNRQNISDVSDRARTPQTLKGSPDSSIIVAEKQIGFRVRVMSVSKEYAMRIDNYWTMYGYPVGYVKKPTRTSRKFWNYTKTGGANIGGSCPSIVKDYVAKIFDAGVTEWHNPNYFMDYGQNNIIV